MPMLSQFKRSSRPATTERDISASRIDQALQQGGTVALRNASASDRISATADERADRAGIAFFQLPGGATAPAPVSRTPSLRTPPMARRGTVPGRQSRVRGVALDLSRGDSDDENPGFDRAV